jgi:hypothetical protein
MPVHLSMRFMILEQEERVLKQPQYIRGHELYHDNGCINSLKKDFDFITMYWIKTVFFVHSEERIHSNMMQN